MIIIEKECLGEFMSKMGDDCNSCPHNLECWRIFKEKDKELQKYKNIKLEEWYKELCANNGICSTC